MTPLDCRGFSEVPPSKFPEDIGTLLFNDNWRFSLTSFALSVAFFATRPVSAGFAQVV